MPWNGAGVYSPPAATFPELNGTIVDANRYNPTILDLATGITNALTKDGQNIPSANLPMGGLKHTGAGDAVAAGQYLVWGQTLPAGLTRLGLSPGSAAAPALFQNADDNTGLFFPAGDVLAAAVTGVEGWRLDSTGFGVGVAPGVKFHVKGAANVIRLDTTTARGSGNGYFSIYDPSGLKAIIGYFQADDNFFLGNVVANNLLFMTNNIARCYIAATGELVPFANNAYTFGTTALRWSSVLSVLGNFTGQVSAGSLALIDGAITGATTGTFSAGLTAATGTFSGAVSMGALAATVGAFSSTLTAADIDVTNNITAAGGFNSDTVQGGTYTPTLTNVTNIDSSAVVGTFKWIRVENAVFVEGCVTIDATAAAAVELGISLPVASALSDANQVTGFAQGGPETTPLSINGDATNDRSKLTYAATSTVSQTYRLHFGYEIL